METSWRSNPPAFGGGDDRTTELSVPEEGITVSAGPPDMPHWADPPTGEVPRLRFEEDPDDGEDDLEAWKALGSRGARWRHEDDWGDSDELSDLATEEPLGALDSTRTEHSDLYSFDEDFERVTNRTGSSPVVDLTGEDDLDEPFEPRPVAPRWRASRSSRRGSTRRPPARPAAFDDDLEDLPVTAQVGAGSRSGTTRRGVNRPSAGSHRADRGGPAGSGVDRGDLTGRVGIGAGLVVLLIIAYAVGPKALLALTAIVLVAAAAEAYSMVRAAGFRPATLLGLVATAGCVLAAYWKGPSAIGVVAVFLFAGAMLWYVLGIVEARPLANAAVTVMVFVWVAVLGSFAAVMLAQHHGRGEFLGAIVVAVVADICAFGVGRWIGSRPLAAHISPNKTVEGFIGGLIGAIIAGAIIGKELAPWGGMKHGLALGVVIGLLAPVGDLFESVIKRDLGIKDSGSVLAGHGGLLDRFDGVLIALPAAYFVITFFKL